MKFRIKERNTIPYGGYWVWKDPITGLTVKGTHWNMLLDRIRDERKANGIPIGLGFEEELERDLCRDFPGECEWSDPSIPRNRRLTMHDVVQGTRFIAAFKAAGSPLVAHEEATRRAQICSKCPFNVQFTKPCAGLCPELLGLVQSVTGIHNRTQYDEDLRSCSLCGCYTRVSVWVPLDIQRGVLSEDQRKMFDQLDFCWKKG